MPKRFLALLLACHFLAGCGNTPSGEIKEVSTTNLGDATGEPGQGGPAVKVSILSFDEIQELLASKRGKVVVMDAWSTACPPCMKDFHNLVELSQQYPSDELACISLSFDYEGIGKPLDVMPNVLKFLHSQRATFDNVMSNEESDVLYRKFKLNSVPAVFVYDRTGKLRDRFEKEGAYERVRALVAELVKEASPAEGASASP